MLNINFTETDFEIADFENRVWTRANSAAINRYWSGATAPAERHSVARLLWSNEYLYVRFDAVQNEPLVVSQKPDLTKKTVRLWNRDVCEIFIAPETPHGYFEFEVAPTGEWVDLALKITDGERETNWDYDSGMETAAKIDTDLVMMGIKIPWNAFNNKPDADDVWMGNLFRIVGEGEWRGYLAWRSTETEVPSFHVPERFGKLKFLK